MNRYLTQFILLLACTASAVTARAEEDTIKLAFIDPLSGPFATVGDAALKTFQFAVDEVVNDKGGVLDGRKMEVIYFDSKGSARNTQRKLREAIDQGARYVLQGSSSHVANELTKAISRRNAREPDDPVVFIDYAANDPALTNENCSFWHFRFDVHAEMKVAALAKTIAANPEIKSIYIIGQDYGFGHAVSESMKRYIHAENKGIEIVGDVFHPVGLVEDFGPYADAIRTLNPDAIVSGNWGVDMDRLLTAVHDEGLEQPIYTLFGATTDERSEGKLHMAHAGLYSNVPDRLIAMSKAFTKRFPESAMTSRQIITSIEFLAGAIEKAGTDDPLQVAFAMEEMEMETITGDTVRMRSRDHQMIKPIRVSVQRNDVENIVTGEVGPGYVAVGSMAAEQVDSLPTSCQMDRPVAAVAAN